MVAVIQQIGGGAAVVPHGVRVFDGGTQAVGEVLVVDLVLRPVQNVALGSGDLSVVPDAVIGLLVVHAEQGDAAFVALLCGLDYSAVDDPVVLVQLIQLELRAVQGVAVLRVHLLDGEVIVIIAVIAAVTAVARPLRVENDITEHLDGTAFRVGYTAAVRLRVPAGKGAAVTCIAVCLYCGYFTGSVGRDVGGPAGVSAVSIVGHGVGGHGKL